MALADFAGGVQEALAELIKQRLEAEEVQRKERQHADEMGLRKQGLDLQGRQVGLSESRFGYEQERDLKGDQAAASQAQGHEDFEATLPEHLRPIFHAGGHKAALKPEDFETPLTPEQREERRLKGIEGEETVRETTRGRIRARFNPRTPAQAPALDKVDLGDRVALMDRQGNIVKELPKGTRPTTAGDGAAGAGDPKGVARAQEIKALAAEILNDDSLDDVFGPLQGALPTLRGGTSRAEAKIEKLISLMTIGDMGIMKGVLSDADIKMLKSAQTILQNRRIDDATARAEIARIAGIGSGGGETAGAVPPEVSAILSSAPDGRHTLSDGSVWIKQGGQIRPGG